MASSNMMTPESSMLSGPVSILWDIENCHVPRDVNPEDVAGNIRMALRMHPLITGAVTHFSAFGDFNGFRRELREGCQRTGVKLVDVPNGRKDAADKAILVDMFLFALDNPPPSSILLISGDVDFAPALHVLGQRGYSVILVIPAGVNVSSALTNAGRFVWDWPSVARGEGLVPPKFPIPRVPSLVKNAKGREEDIPVDIRICRNTSSSSDDFSDEKKIEMVGNCGSGGTVDCQTQKEQTFPQNPVNQKTQNPNQTPISKNPETLPENSNSQSPKPQSRKYQNFTRKPKTLPKNPTPKSNPNPKEIETLSNNPTPKSNGYPKDIQTLSNNPTPKSTPNPKDIKTSPKYPAPKSNPNPEEIETLSNNPTPKSNLNPKDIQTLPKNPTPESNPNPKKIETLPKNPIPKSNPNPKEIETLSNNPTPKSNVNPKDIQTLPKNPTPKSNPNPKDIQTLPKNPTPKSNPNPQKDKNITKKTEIPNQPKTQKYQNFPETQNDHTFTKKPTKIPKTATKTPNLNVDKQKQHLERTSDTDPTLENPGSNPLDSPQIPQSPRPADVEAAEVGLDGTGGGGPKRRKSRIRARRKEEFGLEGVCAEGHLNSSWFGTWE